MGKRQSKQEETVSSTYAAPMYRSTLISTIMMMSLMIVVRLIVMRIIDADDDMGEIVEKS